MEFLRSIATVSWYSSILLDLFLLVIVWKKRVGARLPAFFLLVALEVVRDAVFFALYPRSYRIYFYAFWLSEPLCMALNLAVLGELCHAMLQHAPSFRKAVLRCFHGATALAVAAAFAYAVHAPDADAHRLLVGIITLDRSVRLVQCAMLGVLLLAGTILGAFLDEQVFGITLGLCIYDAVQLMSATWRASSGPTLDPLYSSLSSISYLLAAAVWVGYLVLPGRVVQEGVELPPAPAADWRKAFGGLFRR